MGSLSFVVHFLLYNVMTRAAGMARIPFFGCKINRILRNGISKSKSEC